MAPTLGSVGVWSPALRFGDPAETADAARELEELGYGTLWFPAFGEGAFAVASALLEATTTVAVATGIRSVWVDTAERTAAAHADLANAHPGRFVLGLGASHAPVVEMEAPDRQYGRPLEVVAEFLDELDRGTPPVPAGERVLAALGPRMLALARDRTSGAHPYLVTPEHTAQAREILGAGRVLAPEQTVVLETDATKAREVAREHLAIYLGLPNYVNNLRRLGFGDDDVTPGGSDRLVDGLVAWGGVDAVAARVQAHHDAGADHVTLQVLGEPAGGVRMADLRLLSEVLAA